MATIDIYLTKTVEQNAGLYYEKAKRARQKRDGVLAALERTHKQLAQLTKEKEHALSKLAEKARTLPARKKEWYEKFHWFTSGDGFLCIGGRDATSNEVLIKKHLDKTDLVLHTDLAGSPFFIVKNGQQAPEQTLKEAAQATASYSKAWTQGLSTLEVFYVNPEQVSKKAKSGEYMPKGAFMIYGETKYLHPLLGIAIGITPTGQIIGGPLDAIKLHAKPVVLLSPGKEKTSDIAKKIKYILKADSVDEIISFIPAGGSMVKKEK